MAHSGEVLALANLVSCFDNHKNLSRKICRAKFNPHACMLLNSVAAEMRTLLPLRWLNCLITQM
jgi:hypothetical protein